MSETPADELNRLRSENKALREQRDELQKRGTQLLLERRAVDRASMVRTQFLAFGQEDDLRISPATLPSEARMRFSLRLVAEEFFELFEAVVFGGQANHDPDWSELRAIFMQAIDELPLAPNLEAIVKESIDLDVVTEGLRLRCGIDSTPFWLAVHDSNCAKRNGPVRESDGKRLKPPDWQPPDIAGLLRAVRHGMS